jgi:phosphoglycolate phosphatase
LTSTTASGGPLAAAPATDPRVFLRPGFAWDAQPAYLFDIDGTLLRSQDRIHYTSFFSSVKSVMGRELVLDEVVVHGNTDPGILRDAFRVARLPDEDWHPMLEDVLDAMRADVLAQRGAMQLRVMPGVPETLAYLHSKGAALGVATGNLESIGWLKIEVAQLRDWFTFGGFSDRFAVRADMIAHAAAIARAIVSPDASVCVVGDTPFDITAAQANSLPVIAVATGRYSFDELMQFGPDVCVTTLETLLRQTRPGA